MTIASSSEATTILTIDQAAAYLTIPKPTLYTWRTRRVGFGPPAVKIGGCLRYRLCDLEAWVAEHVETFGGDRSIPESRPAGAPSAGAGVSLSRASGPR
jgi:predicted DNA-binding transcriptional regulator AlpA